MIYVCSNRGGSYSTHIRGDNRNRGISASRAYSGNSGNNGTGVRIGDSSRSSIKNSQRSTRLSKKRFSSSMENGTSDYEKNNQKRTKRNGNLELLNINRVGERGFDGNHYLKYYKNELVDSNRRNSDSNRSAARSSTIAAKTRCTSYTDMSMNNSIFDQRANGRNANAMVFGSYTGDTQHELYGNDSSNTLLSNDLHRHMMYNDEQNNVKKNGNVDLVNNRNERIRRYVYDNDDDVDDVKLQTSAAQDEDEDEDEDDIDLNACDVLRQQENNNNAN